MDSPLLTTTQPTQEIASSSVTSHPSTPNQPQRVYDLYSWEDLAPDTRLVYIRDVPTAQQELSRLKPGPLGFDLEWKPNYRKGGRDNPVALVQLANEDTILLIQLTTLGVVPEALTKVLQSPDYIKAGVSILNDCKKLWQDYRVNVRNCVDLGLLARTVDNNRWKGKYAQPIGLARLCETYHELTLHKGKVTRSNWEAYLKKEQILYAANDCHSGLTLFNKLHALVDSIDPAPLPAFYSFDWFNGLPYQPSELEQPQILWQPHNPFYDPGPAPPPKPSKPRKPRPERTTQDNAVNAVNANRNLAAGASAPLSRNGAGLHQLPVTSVGWKSGPRIDAGTTLAGPAFIDQSQRLDTRPPRFRNHEQPLVTPGVANSHQQGNGQYQNSSARPTDRHGGTRGGNGYGGRGWGRGGNAPPRYDEGGPNGWHRGYRYGRNAANNDLYQYGQ